MGTFVLFFFRILELLQPSTLWRILRLIPWIGTLGCDICLFFVFFILFNMLVKLLRYSKHLFGEMFIYWYLLCFCLWRDLLYWYWIMNCEWHLLQRADLLYRRTGNFFCLFFSSFFVSLALFWLLIFKEGLVLFLCSNQSMTFYYKSKKKIPFWY